MSRKPHKRPSTSPAIPRPTSQSPSLLGGSRTSAATNAPHTAGSTGASPVDPSVTAIVEKMQQLVGKLHAIEDISSASQELLDTFEKLVGHASAERADIEANRAALAKREAVIRAAEEARDRGFSDERERLDEELTAKRVSDQAALEAELADIRSAALSQIQHDVQARHEQSEADLARERINHEAWVSEQAALTSVRREELLREAKELDRRSSELQRQAADLERQKGAVAALQSELDGRQVEIEQIESDLERRYARQDRLAERRGENIDSEVAALVEEARKSFQAQLVAATEETDRLRRDLVTQTELISAYTRLEQQLDGREPSAVIAELAAANDELARQREELASRPTEGVRQRLVDAENLEQTLRAQIKSLEQELSRRNRLAEKAGDLERSNRLLTAENEVLSSRADIFEGQAREAMAEASRLRAAYARPEEIDERYAEIELPRFDFDDVMTEVQPSITELEWITGIGDQCDAYGLHFPPRILKAFHTSLKTAEWSPLTILAGVSGTGKSELPRLYSHFGGLYFESLSVQPNWDSQESMLGYFNSIDNRFDAQPVLRFLAQSQKPYIEPGPDGIGYPGLGEAMCMVLLDEMNLAHPELYLAEFLSKLELRRGRKGADVPTLPVKIGAGMKPYDLKLGRNVLWAGTMNQDETTKSLSDKVLDRAIIIHFPRPTTLQRRQKLAPLDKSNRGHELPAKMWRTWLAQESTFTADDVRPFKTFIETINDSLAVVGRALGHRVWQAIEYYMANYPDVRAALETGDTAARDRAMHVAFEDQLVQKVMPKLRGIDTRGTQRGNCLDAIRAQLIEGVDGNGFNLTEDFNLAMELGYGQFMWQTANYLRDEPPTLTTDATTDAHEPA